MVSRPEWLAVNSAVAQEPFHTFWAKATELDAANTSAKDKIFIACLFIVKDGNLSYYTRNGNFKFDKEGYYVNSDGLKVQGWSATTPGDAINTNGQPSEICIPAGKTMAASATTKATFSSNLNAAEQDIGRQLLQETAAYAESSVCRRKLQAVRRSYRAA